MSQVNAYRHLRREEVHARSQAELVGVVAGGFEPVVESLIVCSLGTVGMEILI